MSDSTSHPRLKLFDTLESSIKTIPVAADQLQAAAALATLFTAWLHDREILAVAIRQARSDLRSGHPHPSAIIDRFERLLEDPT